MDFNQAIQFLNKDPENHFFEMINQDTNKHLLHPNTRIFLKDIPEGNIEAFLHSKVARKETPIKVFVIPKRVTGNSERKAGEYFAYEVEALKQVEQPMQNNTPVAQNNQPQQPQQSFLGNPLGLSVPEVLKSMVNTERLEDFKQFYLEAKEDIRDLKEELRDNKRSYEKKIDNLDDQLKEAKSVLSVKDRETALLIKEVESNQKSFFDSDGFAKISEMAQNIIAAKMGGSTSADVQGLSYPGLTENKQSIIEFIATDECSENEVTYIGAILSKMKEPVFLQQLTAIINKK